MGALGLAPELLPAWTMPKMSPLSRILPPYPHHTALSQHIRCGCMLRGSGSSIFVPFNNTVLGPIPSCARKTRNVHPNYFYFFPPLFFEHHTCFSGLNGFSWLACPPNAVLQT